MLTAYNQILQHDGLKYQIFKIDDVANEVIVDDFGDEVGDDLGYQVKVTETEDEDRAAFEEFVERINNFRTRSPRYCLFSFGSNDDSKLVFIYWLVASYHACIIIVTQQHKRLISVAISVSQPVGQDAKKSLAPYNVYWKESDV